MRLREEIDVLSKRANLNLIIGSLITVGGLVLLGYFVIRPSNNAADVVSLLVHFVPRLSLVLFIELFSLFFLKLYRSSLSEIKYYQNELTNIELKESALLTAIHCGTMADISSVISTLAITERNFKLHKDESTVELERDKMEMNILKGIVKQFNQQYSLKS